MPTNDPAPTFAYLTEVDARAWSGSIFDMSGGGLVALPTQDFWEDALNLLNGRCSAATHDLDARVKIIKGGTWTIYLNGSDRVVIEDTAGAFTLNAGFGEAAYGFPNAPYASAVVAGPTNQIIADAEWVRGNVQNAHLALDDGAVGLIPDVAFRSQDVITMLRSTTLADADGDDRVTNLEVQTNAAYGSAQGYRWGINATGFAWLAVDSASGTAPDASGFLNDDLQRFLGFKGDETTQVIADASTGTSLEVIEATYPCEGAIVPSRPLNRITARFDETTNTARLTSREIASNKVMDYNSWVVEWWLDGPADCIDLSTHWINSLVRRAQKGNRWALYQVWGDPRRAIFTADVRTDTSGTVDAFSLLSTAELDGYRGRIRGRRSINDTAQKANRWPSRLRRRIPMGTIIEAAEDDS